MFHAQRFALNGVYISMISLMVGCGSSDPTEGFVGVGGAATANGTGGAARGGAASGGTFSAAGTVSGGFVTSGGLTGGTVGGMSNGGATASNGGASAGGTTSQGGASKGGSAHSGGATSAGGTAVGGAVSRGGASTGGSTSAGGGGASAVGGTVAKGGAATGGASALGGAAGCPVELVGWATVNANNVNGTTGGGNVTPTTVTTLAAFKAAVQDFAPRVVIVSGTLKTTDADGLSIPIASNKTIVGADKHAKIYGGIVLNGVSNVIIRNLNVQGVYPNSGPDDTVASHNSHHVWYDHMAIWDAGDGLLDITNQSNYHTVSWTKFYYTNAANGHRLASLNGSGGGDHPEDSRYLKSTYHHNWWSSLVNERMPRMMYGKLHAFNNYYNAPGNLYCIGVGSFGSALVENNYFKDVKGPHVFMYDWHMYIAATANVYDNTTGNKDTGPGGTRDTNDPALNAGVEDAAAFTPPYQYTLDKAADVPALVQKCAGPQ